MASPDYNTSDDFDSFEMRSGAFSRPMAEPSPATRKRIRRPVTPEPESQAASPALRPRRQPQQPLQSQYSEPSYPGREQQYDYDDSSDEVYPDEAIPFEPQQVASSTPNRKPKTQPAKTPKATNEPNAADKAAARFVSIFSDGRLAIFAGIIIFLVAAYMLITSISFLSNGTADQNLVENNTLSQLAPRHAEVQNTGGPFGAFLSNLIISRWLGLGSFVVILYMFLISISLLRIRKCQFWSLSFKSLITAIATSVIVGAATYNSSGAIFWGGEHGYYVNQFLLANTGIWGDLAVNMILAAAVALIFLDTLRKIFNLIRQMIDHYKRTLEEHRRVALEKEQAEEYDNQQTSDTPTDETTDTLPTESVQTPPAPEPEYPTEPQNPTIDIELPTSVVPQTQPTDTDAPSQPSAEMDIITSDIEQASKIYTEAYDPTAELSRYRRPSLDLLREVSQKSISIDQQEQEMNKDRITKTLKGYGIEIAKITATVGPTITLYEIIPAEGVRIAKIKRLGDDMAMSLSALGIRIIAPMPGKGTIGMEVPNRDKQIVGIRNILSSKAYQESKAELPMAMGSTIDNQVFVEDLCKMPHLLVAGATGMGKSVGLNTIIASLLYKKHPAELKFVMIDPKMVEFSLYNVLERHFLAKLPDEEDAIITDPLKVIATLNSLCVEMDNRYDMLKNAGVRDIKSYNQKFISRRLNPEKGHHFLPYIVVVVDEFADLILTAGKEIETPISRIAAKARAVGIHMILATQRPSVNVITGTIKANFPGRIAFRVMQTVDSRTIIDRPGAEQLIGRGDMLFSTGGLINRVQCALIETDEVERICEFISNQIGYDSAYELPEYTPAPDGGKATGAGGSGERDSLFEEAGRFIIESGIGSTTSIQRHFNVGYPRAGKIMDQLQNAGVVSPAQGGKPRNVLMDIMAFNELLLRS